MKLRNYFLLSIVVGAAVACSSNEDIPEEHVFTPNATLSLATGVYGDGRTKAVGIDVTEEQIQEMAEKCIVACGGFAGKVKKLYTEDVANIYRMAK